MGLMLFWTSYKQKQAMAELKQKREQQVSDSLAQVAKNGGRPLANSTSPSEKPAKGEATLGQARDAAGQAGMLQASNNDSALAASQVLGEKLLGDSAAPALIPRRFLTVETNKFKVKLDNEGAKVSTLSLNSLGSKPLYNPEIIPDKGGALALTIDRKDLNRTVWELDNKSETLKVSGAPATVKFKTTLPGTRTTLVRSFTFYPDSNKFSQRLESSEPISSYGIGWQSGLEESEKILNGKGFGLMSTFFSEVILDNGTNVAREAFDGKKTFNEESGVLKWVGLRRKYVAALINFNAETTNKVVATGTLKGDDSSYPKDYELEIIANNYDEKVVDFDFVILPLSYDKLLTYKDNYEKIIFSGWESFFRADIWYVALCGMVLHLLNFFHGIIPNYGIAIILLTLLVRIVTFPLTISQTKQGVKMQQHMPAIAKIREKNKGQPQKANAEIMAYYKEKGVNPLSGVMGCFPVLLQMPIFIALFNVLGRAVELKGAPFGLWVHDLSLPDVVFEAFKVPYLFPLGLTILPFFMAATMYFQMKLTIKDPNQKMMVWMMPIMMFVFSCAFPSGLVLYWTVSNLFTIGQTYFYTNKLTASAANASKVIVSKVKG
jgi:YidC/Oxa1 family membrane protein insertase